MLFYALHVYCVMIKLSGASEGKISIKERKHDKINILHSFSTTVQCLILFGLQNRQRIIYNQGILIFKNIIHIMYRTPSLLEIPLHVS
mgnify:CR=1 FL=1